MPPLKKDDATKLITRRHAEWREHQKHWRFLADSLEGGDRYKHADYVLDTMSALDAPFTKRAWYAAPADALTSERVPIAYGQIVDRNLVPHLRETGKDGRDLYAMRLHRTPVPALVERAVESHLARIYSREVTRDGPGPLKLWWEDVDGRGTPADRWMAETVAPLFGVLGMLDVLFDHPKAPEGVVIRSKRDTARLGLDACVASIVLPENVLWWELDQRGRYEEVLLYELHESGGRYVHWTAAECNAYRHDGEAIDSECREHPFGRVPVVRVFDRRMARCANVGKSRYASVASLQKAVYNALSELILSDVQQSHAQLAVPEEYCQSDSEVPVGPDRMLPMKPIKGSNGLTAGYQTPAYVEPPKGAQKEIRQHILDWQDQADRDAALSKPAGMAAGSTTAQSGVSKILDQTDGNALLAKLAKSLAAAEVLFAEFALAVLSDGEPDPAALEAVAINYPGQFDLYTLSDLAQVSDDVQRIAAGVGALPQTEGELLKRLVALALPGIPAARLAELHAEVDDFVARVSRDPEGVGGDAGSEGGPAPAAGDATDRYTGDDELLTAPADPAAGALDGAPSD